MSDTPNIVDTTVVDLPQPEAPDDVWLCGVCGCFKYHLCRDHTIKCNDCGRTMDFQWFDPTEAA